MNTDSLFTAYTGRKLQNILKQLNFTVANHQPTRVTDNTSTLIDLVITSKPELIKSTRTLELGISDHMLVHASVRTKVKHPSPRVIREMNCLTIFDVFSVSNGVRTIFI